MVGLGGIFHIGRALGVGSPSRQEGVEAVRKGWRQEHSQTAPVFVSPEALG